MKTENLSTLKIHKLTKIQYERELAAGNIDENALYLTPDEEIDLSPYATVEQLNTHNTDTDVHANMGWLTSEDETVGTPALINADTLGGRNASYFASQEELDNISYFGMRYSDATEVIDLSDSVKMYLFATTSGYDAVVVGDGAIPDYTENNHPYEVEKINRLHLCDGITSIGNYFMYKAYNLCNLSFENSKSITNLGTLAFGYTSISGEYDFTGVTDTKLDAPFMHCPKLDGLSFNNTVTEITEKAFQMCIALRFVRGLSNVITIGNAAFQYCTSLESIDVVPGNVTLGDWVFILTPIDSKANETVLAEAAWKAKGSLCFAQNEWTAEQLTAIQAITGESAQMPIPQSDNQKTVFYEQWGVFPLVYNGVYQELAHPASGCCGIFSLYHIYNILHPNKQYDSFYDWMMCEVVPNRIEVTQSLYNTLNNCEYGQILMQGNTTASYGVGSKITARDLPMALDADAETWGEEGTAFWGVCTALGWIGTRIPFESGKNSGANVKQVVIDSIGNNKPVVMEIVGAGAHRDVSGHGMHAVVAIGYDAMTDKLLIIDSTGGFDADVIPLSYWCKFESLTTPHQTSAIWTFDFGEVINMTEIDNKLSILIESTNSGFHTESGTMTIATDMLPAQGEQLVEVKVPCTSGAKILAFCADDVTFNKIKTLKDINYLASFIGNSFMPQYKNHAGKVISPAMMMSYYSAMANYPGYNDGWIVDGATVSKFSNTDGYSFKVFAVTAGTYHWTAYYWND